MLNALLVLSDTHCGSSVALAHPESEQEEGNVVGFGRNYHQEWLWQCWNDALRQAKAKLKGANIGLVINGDATEGAHHRTAELIAASIEEHCEIARKCLLPFREITEKAFVVKGTECHTHGMENKLAHDLKAEAGKAKNKWLIRVNGTLVDIAHHIGTSSRAYLEASQMSIGMQNARLNYQRTNQEPPSVFLRGHRHCGGLYSDGSSMIGITGAWQFLTRFGHKAVTDSIPRPSMILLDWRGRKQGELPNAEQIVFNPPQEEIVSA